MTLGGPFVVLLVIGNIVSGNNFDVPPETGGTPATRYAFDTDAGGRWFFQLENDLQGGRWEEADHAKEDFERYKALGADRGMSQMHAMGGESGEGGQIARVIGNAVAEDVSFDELRRRLKSLNTHRQISDGEPQADGATLAPLLQEVAS